MDGKPTLTYTISIVYIRVLSRLYRVWFRQMDNNVYSLSRGIFSPCYRFLIYVSSQAQIWIKVFYFYLFTFKTMSPLSTLILFFPPYCLSWAPRIIGLSSLSFLPAHILFSNEGATAISIGISLLGIRFPRQQFLLHCLCHIFIFP